MGLVALLLACAPETVPRTDVVTDAPMLDATDATGDASVDANDVSVPVDVSDGAAGHGDVGSGSDVDASPPDGVDAEAGEQDCPDAPCQHGGQCVETPDGVACDCAGTDHGGPLCDAPPSLYFTDVTAESGIDYLQSSVQLIGRSQVWNCTLLTSGHCGVTMTGSAAAGDYDRDGWVDLFVTRVDAPDVLYRNAGDGTFEDVSAAVGLVVSLPSNGAAWADVDNDGDLDLYVTTMGGTRFHLFINQLDSNADEGGTGFIEEAILRGAAADGMGTTWGQAPAFGDYDRDGWLDLHTNEWRDFETADGQTQNHARLVRNLGEVAPGHFEDVTEAAGVGDMVTFNPLNEIWSISNFASTFSDLDADGWPDLAITGDWVTSRLFWNNGDGTFTDGTSAAAINGTLYAMGTAIGDVDGDGLLDWFIDSIHFPPGMGPGVPPAGGDPVLPEGNKLYRNNGDRTFSDVTLDHDELYNGHWAWGTSFGDFDNDADLDLVLTTGMDLGSDLEIADEAFWKTDPMRFWLNESGVLVHSAETVGLTDTGDGNGLLTFDYDRDGDLDIFIVHVAGQPVLYRNDGGNARDHLRIEFTGTTSNRDGFGAVVHVQTVLDGPEQIREHRAGAGYGGQNEPMLHIGLGPGDAPVHRVRVRWPTVGSEEEVVYDVPRNTTLHLVEPP